MVEGICKADVEALVEVGFNRGTTEKLCGLIRERATTYGVHDLVEHYEKAKRNGASNIINIIVRNENKIYFASRSQA